MSHRLAALGLSVVLGCGSASPSQPPPPTAHGVTLARATEAATVAGCANGGVQLDWGVDANGNGVLDAAEVTRTYSVCNGADGQGGIAATDKAHWDAAYGWGDHATAGYLKAESDPAFSASAAASVTSDQMSRWSAAYGWGNHAQAGYLTSEADPVFSASVASTISTVDTSRWSTAYAWGDHATAGYLKAEADPKVGALTSGQWCRGTGSQVTCDQAPPLSSESDPHVGTLTAGRWCSSDGTKVTCTQTAPLTAETDPKVGTLTASRWCSSDGSTVSCTQNPPVTSEADPKVGTLITGRWCTTDGTKVTCTQTAPVMAETDPKVGTLVAGRWCTSNGYTVDCSQSAPLLWESDPSFRPLIAGTETSGTIVSTWHSVVDLRRDGSVGGWQVAKSSSAPCSGCTYVARCTGLSSTGSLVPKVLGPLDLSAVQLYANADNIVSLDCYLGTPDGASGVNIRLHRINTTAGYWSGMETPAS